MLEELALAIVCSSVGMFLVSGFVFCFIILISYEAISKYAEPVFYLNVWIYEVHAFNFINFCDCG